MENITAIKNWANEDWNGNEWYRGYVFQANG